MSIFKVKKIEFFTLRCLTDDFYLLRKKNDRVNLIIILLNTSTFSYRAKTCHVSTKSKKVPLKCCRASKKKSDRLFGRRLLSNETKRQ